MSNLIFTWGKFTPPHIGHLKIVNVLRGLALENGYDSMVFTPYPKNYPLTHREHQDLLELAFEMPVMAIQKFADVVNYIVDCEYESAILVVGSDRLEDFQRMMPIYQEEHRNKVHLSAISGGVRDNSEDVEGMSSTKMRAFVENKNRDAFLANLPPTLAEDRGLALFNRMAFAK